MAPKRRRESLKMHGPEDYLKTEKVFRENAITIIDNMMELSDQTPEDSSELIDEVLHSIFFLGHITFHNDSQWSPEKIVTQKQEFDELRDSYPNAFQLFSTVVPRRHPVSILLDMIVRVGNGDEEQIREKLQELQPTSSSERYFISSAICVSQRNHSPDSNKYYGVSMSTVGRPPGRIMIAASCLGYWDDLVAGAVMTYYSKNKKQVKKPYFDGRILIPLRNVRCQTFSLSSGKEMPPCVSCGELFGLQTLDIKKWPYGNCAEAESLSKLLKNESELRNEVETTAPTEEQRLEARDSVRTDLQDLLGQVKFKWDADKFYVPSRIRF